MKRIVFLSLLSCFSIIFACSKSDDSGDVDKDVVFESPYMPLTDLSELDSRVWSYQGSKVGNRKFGYISSSYCLANNILVFEPKDKENLTNSLILYSFNKKLEFCEIEYQSAIHIDHITNGEVWARIAKLSPPTIKTARAINSQFGDEVSNAILAESEEGNENSVKIEIGYQAGMLRVEDKITKYEGKEKAYLYFKKI